MSFKLKEGINICTNSEYHGDTSYFSSSSLKLLLKDPEDFYKQCIKGERVQKHIPAFDEGSYAHTLILEPAMVNKEYAFYEGMRKQGKDWEVFKASNAGKIILSKPQKVRIDRLFRAYGKLKAAKNLVKGGFPEHTVAGQLMGVPLKARADYINIEQGYIADVKTTGHDTDQESFKYTIDQFGYALSAALYAKMFEMHYGKKFDFYFIVLGKKDESCEVFKASEDMMNKGFAQVRKAISTYKKCKENNIWTSDKKFATINTGDYEILEV